MTATPIQRPTSKTALIKYLRKHPFLRFEFPAGHTYKHDKSSFRRFLGTEEKGTSLLLEVPDGRVSALAWVHSRHVEFHDDHFAVSLPWDEGAFMRYFYLDEAPEPWSQHEHQDAPSQPVGQS